MVFNLQRAHEYMAEMAMFNVQKTTIPKVGKPELQFMCFARHLIVHISFVKISWTVSIMERTQMLEALMDGQTDTQNFGGYIIIPLPLFVVGHKNKK